MDTTSDYKYFRYLMFLNYILGHFTTDHIFTKDSEKLEFKVAIVPLCSALIQLFMAVWVQAIFVLYFLKGHYLVFVHNISFVAIDLALVLWGLFFGSKTVINTFKTADRLRKTMKHLPDELQVPRTNPTIFAAMMTLLFVALHLNEIHSLQYYTLNFLKHFYWDAYILYTARYPHRLCLTLSSLYYLCGLAVLDTRRAWKRYSCTCCRPYLYLETFSRVLMEQTYLLQNIDKALGKQVLLLLIYRSCNVVTNMPFWVYHSEDPVQPAVYNLVLWTILLGLLTGSICFTSVQLNKLSQDILTTPARFMSRKDTHMVRLLLSQIEHNPGQFTGGGYVLLGSHIFLIFLSLGIDYAIMFYQNLDVIRSMMGNGNLTV